MCEKYLLIAICMHYCSVFFPDILKGYKWVRVSG